MAKFFYALIFLGLKQVNVNNNTNKNKAHIQLCYTKQA